MLLDFVNLLKLPPLKLILKLRAVSRGCVMLCSSKYFFDLKAQPFMPHKIHIFHDQGPNLTRLENILQ